MIENLSLDNLIKLERQLELNLSKVRQVKLQKYNYNDGYEKYYKYLLSQNKTKNNTKDEITIHDLHDRGFNYNMN